jgi:26S proteasome non-ATPase regulatory subunit 9
MKTPLVDKEGFPRADIDIYAIRNAQAALVPLYNDLKVKMDEIHEALIAVHAQSKLEGPKETPKPEYIPFAKINGVAPDSPGSEGRLQRGDLVIQYHGFIRFGEIDWKTQEPLKKIAAMLPDHEFKTIRVRVQRGEQQMVLVITPKPWSGKGLLGCHLTPL